MEFIDPRKTPFVEPRTRGELPHLYKPGGHYFVTYRLYDAVVPRPADPPKPTDSTRPPIRDALMLAAEYDPPLALGSCVLRRPEIASVMIDALLAQDGTRYDLDAWCVMPNHVHVIFAPLREVKLSGILQAWKGATSRQINLLLGRTGTLWERESFDHLIRSAASFQQFIHYVEQNPVAAGFCARPEDWPFSSAHRHRRA